MLLLFPYLGRMIIDNLLTFLAIKLLHVNIKMSQQNRVLCSDKSYIQTKQCVLYLIHESVLSYDRFRFTTTVESINDYQREPLREFRLNILQR